MKYNRFKAILLLGKMKKAAQRIRITAVLILSLFALSIVGVSPQTSLAETTNFPVSADTWVSSQFPDTNYGGASSLFVFHNANDGRAYFNFDLSSLPANSTITSATLVVYALGDSGLDCSGDPTTFTIGLASSSWLENKITWNNRAGLAASFGSWLSCYSGWAGLSVTPLVQEISSGTKTNNGFFLYGSGADFKRTLISKESSSSHPAHLEIVYTPPAALPAPDGGTGDNDADQGSTTTGTATGTKTSPTAKTSTSIIAPGELTAKDAGATDVLSVNLSWKESETDDIDGYKIFRSENEADGFENIATGDKGTLTYTDTVNDEKTYYYMVRAYRGSEESANSNVASASAKKIIVEKIPIVHNQKYRDWLIIGAVAAGLIVLVGLALLFFKAILPKIRAKKSLPE